jgi:hypothetical protein
LVGRKTGEVVENADESSFGKGQITLPENPPISSTDFSTNPLCREFSYNPSTCNYLATPVNIS